MRKYIISIMAVYAALAWAEVGSEPLEFWKVGSGYQCNMTYYAQVLRKDGIYIDNARACWRYSTPKVYAEGQSCPSSGLIAGFSS
jgi:hypothetical protein